MAVKWLNRELVVSPYHYALCTSEVDFRKELKRMKVPREEWPPFLARTADACVHFFEKTDGVGHSVIVCIGNTKGKHFSQIAGLLVHEAVHIWQEIRNHLGEKHPSSEFEAYSIQKISQCLIDAYYEQRKAK